LAKPSIKAELTDHVHRLRVEIVVSDDLAAVVFDALVKSVSSGSQGDSLVWMTDVERSAFVHKTV
jgi:nitrogen regulatory protein P-II 1